jgi:hypothetical protein
MSKTSRRVRFDFETGEPLTRERWEQLKAQGALIPDWEIIELLSSAAASRVRTSVSPEGGPVSAESGPASGANSPGSFAWFDPDSSSWKTFQRCLLGGWEEFSETWPRAGTTRNGIAFLRQPLVPRTSVTGSSLSAAETVPTPSASGFGCRDVERLKERRRATKERVGNGNGFGLTLNQWVKMWPTPSATDWKGIYKPETVARRASESTRGVRLPEQVSRDEGNSGELNPAWVEWLMGFPIGWTDLGDSETP